MKEVDTEKQLRDEVSALQAQIQELQEEKLEAAAAVPLEQPDKDSRIVHFLNNPLQQVLIKHKIHKGDPCLWLKESINR